MTTGWATDARHAWRSLWARPLFTSAAFLLTGVAVAACVTAFAITYGILGRPLPYPHSERLAVLWQVDRGTQSQISYPDFADISQATVFDGATAIIGGTGSLRVADAIERVNLIGLEPNGYAMLGATPALGRLLGAADAGRPVAMISHRLWRTRLGSDPNVIGRSLWLSGATYTVIGVLPDGFDFELPVTPTLKLKDNDIWTVLDRTSTFIARRDVSTYEALVRLAPSITMEQARVAVDELTRQLAVDHPATNSDRTFRLVPLDAEIVGPVRRPLLLACGAALAALVVALANLATLTLVRITDRQPELAIREALGAGAFRLRRQLFTEHLAIGAAAATVGFTTAVSITRALTGSAAADLPRRAAIVFDEPVVLFAAGLTVAIVFTLTLLPIHRRGSANSLAQSARGSSRAGRHARAALVSAELAVAFTLSVGALLVGLSLARLFATDPGFRAIGVAAVRVSAYQARYPNRENVDSFIHAILNRLAAMPDVSYAAAGSSLPLSGQTTGTGVLVEGTAPAPGSRQPAGWQFVTPGYFNALGMALLRGRDFTSTDRSSPSHVTVINESLARALFANEDPVGRRITTGDGDAAGDWHMVIGVVRDVRHHALDQEPAPRVYDLLGQHWGRTVYIVARSRLHEAMPLLPSIRRAITELDPEAPVFEASTVEALVRRSAAPYQLAAWLAGGLALASVLLALIGVYAVAAASVSDRVREIGIRAALGAAPSDLLRLFVREGFVIAAAGSVAGVAGSIAVSRMVQSQLFGVRRGDIAAIIPAVAAAVLVVALAATLPAARRAARADPLVAMRAE